MNMEEKIARAICVEEGRDPDDPWCGDGVPIWKSLYLDHAKAVLSALKEPTDGMVSVGNAMKFKSGESVYKSMIQAAEDGK